MTEYLAVQAAVFFALSHILNRRGLVTSNAITASVFSFSVSVLVLWIVVLFLVPFAAFWTPALPYFLVAGIFAPGLGRFLNLTGIERVGVARCVPISNASPIFASVLAVILMGETWTLQNFLGTSLVVSGVVIFSKRERGQAQWRKVDLIFPIMAAFSFAISVNLRKIGLLITDIPLMAAATTASTGFLLGLVMLQVQGGRQAFLLSRRSFGWFLAAGLTNTTAMISVFYALSFGPVVIVEPLIGTNPFMAILLSSIFLRDLEAITKRILVGAACTVGGSILVITL